MAMPFGVTLTARWFRGVAVRTISSRFRTMRRSVGLGMCARFGSSRRRGLGRARGRDRIAELRKDFLKHEGVEKGLNSTNPLRLQPRIYVVCSPLTTA